MSLEELIPQMGGCDQGRVMEQRPWHMRKDEEVQSTGLGDCTQWRLSGKCDPWVSDGAMH